VGCISECELAETTRSSGSDGAVHVAGIVPLLPSTTLTIILTWASRIIGYGLEFRFLLSYPYPAWTGRTFCFRAVSSTRVRGV